MAAMNAELRACLFPRAPGRRNRVGREQHGPVVIRHCRKDLVDPIGVSIRRLGSSSDRAGMKNDPPAKCVIGPLLKLAERARVGRRRQRWDDAVIGAFILKRCTLHVQTAKEGP